MDVDAWPAPKASYSLSSRERNPEIPPSWRMVVNFSWRRRQELVYVCLVADIPDQLIAGGIKNGMQRDGEFNGSKIGAEVTAGLGDR